MSAPQVTSQRLVVSARPRFEVEGEAQGRLGVDLLRLEVSHDEDGMARLEAVFLNWGQAEQGRAPGFMYFDERVLALGRRLVVRAGAEDNEAVIFDGYITALAGAFPDLRPPEIRVNAEDALQPLRLRERTRLFEDEDEGGMVDRIASDHGLRGGADTQGTHHRALWQVNQNDLSFLRERARAADARLEVGDGTLRFKPRRESGGSPIRLSWQNQLMRFEAAADLAHQRTEVRVHGWSVQDKSAIHGTAEKGVLDAEASGGKTGAKVLEDLGWEAVEHLHLEAPATEEEARALAEAQLKRRGRRFLFGRGVTDGTPRLTVGATVELLDLGDWFSGNWNVCTVRHTFDLKDGLRTFFSAERVDLGGGR
ncbi:MAG TPA: hypothetical protein VE153_35765 [Myxococcus sp.]|nr:hypothetical protein [Myxococcus sp.]